MMIVGYLKRYY